MDTLPRTVGLYHPPAARRDSGLTIVARELMGAIMRHGQTSRLAIFMEPGTAPSVELSGGASTHGVLDAEARVRDGTVSVWHDLEHDMTRAVILRQRAAPRVYPLTFSIHNGHPHRHLNTIVLPLLLGSTRPCDAVICPSRSLAEALRRLFEHGAEALGSSLSYRGRIEVIPWGIDLETFRPRDKARARAQFGLPLGATILLYVGRVSPVQKGDILPLLRVLAELRAESARDLLLVIAGRVEVKGYESLVRTYAEHLGIAQSVRFLGHVGPENRHMIHNCGDVFVAPTDWIDEGFGLTPLEAMASGVPQVVSDWDGYRDTVEHEVTGLLVPTIWADCSSDISLNMTKDAMRDMRAGQSVVVDLHSLKESIAALVDNPDLRGRMAERSRRRAVASFSWSRTVDAHESLWAELERIAQRTPAGDDGRPSPYDTPLFDTVGHYASRTLGADEGLVLTDAGRALLLGNDVLPFSGRFEIHDDDLLLELLGALQARSRSVADLLGPRRNPSRALRHLLWLMKFGFVAARK